jgi:hypothetical protein
MTLMSGAENAATALLCASLCIFWLSNCKLQQQHCITALSRPVSQTADAMAVRQALHVTPFLTVERLIGDQNTLTVDGRFALLVPLPGVLGTHSMTLLRPNPSVDSSGSTAQ